MKMKILKIRIPTDSNFITNENETTTPQEYSLSTNTLWFQITVITLSIYIFIGLILTIFKLSHNRNDLLLKKLKHIFYAFMIHICVYILPIVSVISLTANYLFIPLESDFRFKILISTFLTFVLLIIDFLKTL